MRLIILSILIISLNSLQAQTEIYFESGKSNLSPAATKVLDSIVLTVGSHDIFKINGHTDTIGNSESNLVLSEKRALSVKRYLLKHGESNNLEIFALGETRANYASNKQNRRVGIILLKEKSDIVPTAVNDNFKESHGLSIEQFKNSDQINLKNIQFKPGTADFYDQAAIDELQLLRRILRELSSVKIRIEGHVCCVDDRMLSEMRANKVLWYLTDNGIHKDRLSSVGYSNTKPLVAETSAENNQKNRRVEISIVER